MRLRLDGVTRRFAGRAVVDGVSIDVDAGEIVCLLGPSGCGKSTTLRIAAGVERQEAGEVSIDGAVVSGAATHAPPERRGVGLMFQDFALFPHLDAAGNVAFGLTGADRRRRAEEALARVGLAGRGAAYPHELSGGEQQRVALARALAPRPRVMLMDEPFSALDHRLRDAVRDEALSLLKADGAGVLLVTHDPEEAMRMADRIALMRDGRIVQEGAPYHIYNYPVDRRAAEFFSDVNLLHAVVASQQADTPFGRFLTPGLRDGADVEILVRPQHLQIDVGPLEPPASVVSGVPARGRVLRARFMGAVTLVDVVMAHDGSTLQASAPGAFLPSPGAEIWLSLRRDRCFVFPCAVQTSGETPYVAADGMVGMASPPGPTGPPRLTGAFDGGPQPGSGGGDDTRGWTSDAGRV